MIEIFVEKRTEKELIDTEDGHHRMMLLIEKYVDNNVKESLIKEIILFQGD